MRSKTHSVFKRDKRHTPPRKEGGSMTEGQKDAWSGVLLAALMVGILVGGLLILRLSGN